LAEKDLVRSLVSHFTAKGFIVVTNVANLYRCADIALIDKEKRIWIIECKVTDMSKAIRQLKTHRLAADRVFIGTFYKKTHKSTLERIKSEGIGLIYLMPDDTVVVALPDSTSSSPWEPARSILFERIQEGEAF
jgi:hypothetical protein